MPRNNLTMCSFELPRTLLDLLTLAAHEAGISRSELLRAASRRKALDVLGEEVSAETPVSVEQNA